jgi:hypothetical protein
MFEKEPAQEQVPAKPLTHKQIAARLRAKKINVVGVIVCASLCVLLGVVSAVLPAGVSTPWMFVSYAAGYIGVIWALAGMWSHFMGPNAPK